MSDQPGNSMIDMLMRGQLGNQGGDGGASGDSAPLLLHILGQLGPIDIVQGETQSFLQDTNIQPLELNNLGLAKYDSGGMFGLGNIIGDFCNRVAIQSGPSDNITDGISAPGEGEGGGGGDYGGGGGGGDYSGGGGSSDSGIDTSGGSSGGGDFQARVHGGNFEGASFQAEHVSESFIGRPSDVPDVRGGGEMSMSMD